jgi:mono/diheme cytochrome c family protein
VDDKTRLAQPDEVLIASIKNGKTGTVGTMPPWGGTLSDAQITAVLGYVRTSFGAPK